MVGHDPKQWLVMDPCLIRVRWRLQVVGLNEFSGVCRVFPLTAVVSCLVCPGVLVLSFAHFPQR